MTSIATRFLDGFMTRNDEIRAAVDFRPPMAAPGTLGGVTLWGAGPQVGGCFPPLVNDNGRCSPAPGTLGGRAKWGAGPQVGGCFPPLTIVNGRCAQSGGSQMHRVTDFQPPNDSRGFVHKRLLGGAIGLITGGPGGAIGGFLGGGGGAPRGLAPVVNCPSGFIRQGNNCVALTVPQPGFGGALARILPGGSTGMIPAPTAGCPSGFHPNKSTYWTQTEGVVEEGTKCVRNRRRNPLNPRAARRSMSRLGALSKEMKRLEKTLKKIAPRR